MIAASVLGVRLCPTACGQQVRVGQLLCPRCWRRVPPDLQQAVSRTWRAWSRKRDDADRMLAYRSAADAATSAAA